MSTAAYVHEALPGQPGAPVLFLFHGTGGDERQLVPLGRELMPDGAIVSPRGDVAEMGAARFFRRTAEGVYDRDDLIRATRKMADFVAAHAKGASSVIGLGYSNGANILASVLFAHPHLFDAAVLMHPLIPFAPQVAGRLDGRRVLITAERRDPICPPNLTARLEAYLREAGAEASIHWHEGGHELRADEVDAARHFLEAVHPKAI